MQGWPKVLRSELMVLGASLVFAIPVGEADDAIDYLRDVRPILSANCFTCHGPDEQHREADLRLDREEGIDRVVVAGDVAASEMMARIATDDEALIMPPVNSGKELTPDQIEILRRWVEQGGLARPLGLRGPRASCSSAGQCHGMGAQPHRCLRARTVGGRRH